MKETGAQYKTHRGTNRVLLSDDGHLKEAGIFTDKRMNKTSFLEGRNCEFLILFHLFDCTVWLVGSLFPNQGLNLSHIS